MESVLTRQTDTSDIREVKLFNDRGEFLVECWYRRPRNLDPNYRVLILYAGVKTKDAILDLLPDRPDQVLCAVQYPYQRPRRWNEYARWLRDVRLAAYRVVAGGMLATTFLTEREHLEQSRLTVIGASLGSFFGGIHGAIDARVPRTVLVHGGGNFSVMARGYQRLRDRGWPVKICAWLADRLFGTFDPLRYVSRIAPRELVIIAATSDKYFPPESAQCLFDRAGPPKKITWMNTTHVKSKKSEVLESILASVNSYLFSDTTAAR